MGAQHAINLSLRFGGDATFQALSFDVAHCLFHRLFLRLFGTLSYPLYFVAYCFIDFIFRCL